MRKLVAFGLAAALVGGAAPAAAAWTFASNQQVCVGLNICVTFNLNQSSSSQWVLTTSVGGNYGEKLLAVGLYATSGTWDTSQTNVTVAPPTWEPAIVQPDGINSLKAFADAGNGGTRVFELGATDPSSGAQTVAITFSPVPTGDGGLVAAVHVGGFDNYTNCSLFFGSWGDTNYASHVADCPSDTSVPEPVSLVLLGSGLLGLGGLRMRRRNRK